MARKMTTVERVARQRAAQQSHQRRVRGTRRRAMFLQIGGGSLALAMLIAAVLYAGRGTTPGGAAVAASASLGPLTSSRPAGSTGNFQHVSAPLRQGQKPVLLFIGAQYCPFCAAERWPIVKALSRFGSWSNLAIGHSRSGENGFSDVPTFDLLHALYRSPYVVFESKDVADPSGAPLQSLTPEEQYLLNTYDANGSIPFVYVDGYALIGSDYSPAEVQGRSFAEVQRQLQGSGGATYVSDVNAEANLLTGFLCKANGNQPRATCGNAAIRAIAPGIR